MKAKILFVASAIHGNGAKYIATNLAIELKKQFPAKSVLLIDFDFEYPYLAEQFVEDETTKNIDRLATYVVDKEIETSAFKQEVVQTRVDVDLIRGTAFPGLTRNFSTEQIDAVLKKARELYDYVIVVGSAKTNNAGTVVSLMHADYVLCVVRDNMANFKHARTVVRGLKHYCKTNQLLVVYNQLEAQSKRNVLEGLRGFEVKVIGAVQYDNKNVDNENSERKDSLFNKSLNGREFAKINSEIWK